MLGVDAGQTISVVRVCMLWRLSIPVQGCLRDRLVLPTFATAHITVPRVLAGDYSGYDEAPMSEDDDDDANNAVRFDFVLGIFLCDWLFAQPVCTCSRSALPHAKWALHKDDVCPPVSLHGHTDGRLL